MKTYQTIQELIDDSVEVIEKKSISISKILGIENRFSIISEWASRLNCQFSVNGQTIAFVVNNKLYATPYTEGAVNILRASGFTLTCFYVPFSNWDYPKHEKDKWLCLQEEAKKDAIEFFEAECIAYCKKNGIFMLSNSILSNCIEVPNEGIPYNDLYSSNVFYPVLNSLSLDNHSREYLGSYCYSNGIVVFVYCNGKTYIAKGAMLIPLIESFGYYSKWLFVPFSKGETISDYTIATRWEALNEF